MCKVAVIGYGDIAEGIHLGKCLLWAIFIKKSHKSQIMRIVTIII